MNTSFSENSHMSITQHHTPVTEDGHGDFPRLDALVLFPKCCLRN